MRGKISFLSVVCSAALVLFLAAETTAAEPAADFVPNEMVCNLTPQISVDSINALYGTSTGSYLTVLGAYLLLAPEGADVEALAAEIAARPDVAYCHPNYVLDAPEGVQSSQPFLDEMQLGSYPDQEAALTVNVPSAQAVSTGTGIKVGVVDAGVELAHPALSGTATSGFDYVDYDSLATAPAGGPAAGHGTFVAGVVHLVAPAAEARSYRVLDSTGRGDGFTTAEAIIQAVDDGCRVINLSMVMTGKHETIDFAIEYARNNEVLVVAAAGNDSSSVERFPATDSYCLSVTGVDSLNRKADFANYGNKIDICAPATMVYAPHHDTLYAWWNGTSFAAPFVAAQAALLFAADHTATWHDVVDAITESAVNIDALNPGLEGELGNGLIDLSAALEYLLAGTPCGDLNGDRQGPNIADLTYLVDYLFRGGAEPMVPAVANIDGTGSLNVNDVTYLVGYLFQGGSPPVCPF